MKTYHKKTERLATKVFNDVFDKYDPPSVTYGERLKRINKVAVHPS